MEEPPRKAPGVWHQLCNSQKICPWTSEQRILHIATDMTWKIATIISPVCRWLSLYTCEVADLQNFGCFRHKCFFFLDVKALFGLFLCSSPLPWSLLHSRHFSTFSIDHFRLLDPFSPLKNTRDLKQWIRFQYSSSESIIKKTIRGLQDVEIITKANR